MAARVGSAARRSRVLRQAVTDVFDGSYSHDGIVDVDSGEVWIAREGKPVGHSLLVDGPGGIYDRFFTFRFYVPGDAPRSVRGVTFLPQHAHLFLRFVGFWDYRAQCAVPDWDERRIAQNLSQQARYGVAVIRFYVQARLPYAVDVHALGVLGGSGAGGNQYYVWEIASGSDREHGPGPEVDELLAS